MTLINFLNILQELNISLTDRELEYLQIRIYSYHHTINKVYHKSIYLLLENELLFNKNAKEIIYQIAKSLIHRNIAFEDIFKANSGFITKENLENGLKILQIKSKCKDEIKSIIDFIGPKICIETEKFKNSIHKIFADEFNHIEKILFNKSKDLIEDKSDFNKNQKKNKKMLIENEINMETKEKIYSIEANDDSDYKSSQAGILALDEKGKLLDSNAFYMRDEKLQNHLILTINDNKEQICNLKPIKSYSARSYSDRKNSTDYYTDRRSYSLISFNFIDKAKFKEDYIQNISSDKIFKIIQLKKNKEVEDFPSKNNIEKRRTQSEAKAASMLNSNTLRSLTLPGQQKEIMSRLSSIILKENSKINKLKNNQLNNNDKILIIDHSDYEQQFLLQNSSSPELIPIKINQNSGSPELIPIKINQNSDSAFPKIEKAKAEIDNIRKLHDESISIEESAELYRENLDSIFIEPTKSRNLSKVVSLKHANKKKMILNTNKSLSMKYIPKIPLVDLEMLKTSTKNIEEKKNKIEINNVDDISDMSDDSIVISSNILTLIRQFKGDSFSIKPKNKSLEISFTSKKDEKLSKYSTFFHNLKFIPNIDKNKLESNEKTPEKNQELLNESQTEVKDNSIYIDNKNIQQEDEKKLKIFRVSTQGNSKICEVISKTNTQE